MRQRLLNNLMCFIRLQDVSAILAFTFAALLGIILLIWGSNQQRLLDMRAVIDENQVASKKMQLINELIEIARSRTRITAEVIYEKDPFVQDEMGLELDILAARFANRRSELIALELSAEEKRILDDQAAIVPVILPAQRNAVTLATRGGSGALQEAERLLHEVVNPGQNDLVKLFMAFVNLQQRSIDSLTEESRLSYDSALRQNQILAGSALLFGTLLSVLVVMRIRSIQRKIADARDQLEVAVKERTRELAESENMLQSVLDTIPTRVFWKDVTGTYLGCNRLFAQDAGLSDPNEIIGKHDIDLAIASDANHTEKEDREIIDKGTIIIDREESGGQFDAQSWREVTKVRLINDEGKIIGMLGSYSDITERKRVERVKDEFVSTVSHELRTPLTSINGSIGLLLGGVVGKLPEKAMELLDLANRNTSRLLTIINDLLDVQKIEAGKMVYEFAPVDLSSLLINAVEESQEYAKRYQVEFVIKENATVLAYVDEHRMMQVLGNLLSNAAKFSNSGGRVDISLKQNNDQAVISVTDHGRGIPEFAQKTLFDKFTQVDSSDSRLKGGTGLGLTITKAIIEEHNGSIGFTTEEGVGTTFEVTLQAVKGGIETLNDAANL